MSFNTFCNICFMKGNIIKLCGEENEPILNILISFASCPDIVNGIIYICVNCCNKLEEYDRFRELYLTNFVRFRYMYNEYKKHLEMRNAADIETHLKAFVDVNVERPSGTPLIENYEAAQALRNNTRFNLDVCKESDSEFFKIDFDEFVNKKDSSHVDNQFSLRNNISDNETQTCLKNYGFNDDLESNHGSSFPGGKNTHNENKAAKTDFVFNVCDECNKQFTDMRLLIRHKRFYCSNRPHKCDECSMGFTYPCKLSEHKRTHTGEKPYKCDECDMVFTRQSSLKEHKFAHNGNKPYKCDECGMGFTRGYNLKQHKLTHTGEKPYKCEECGLGFIQRSNLKSHQRIHTAEKPYKCDECSMRFGQQSVLKRHKLTHTGEKPYSCDECQKKFADKSNFMKHKRIHSGKA